MSQVVTGDADAAVCSLGSSRTETQLLAEGSPVDLAVEELAGMTLAEASDAYEAHRAGESANESFSTGTKLGRARRRYGALLNADRRLRQEYDNPTVAMLTLTGTPVWGGEWITPVEHTEAVTESLGNVLEALRYHLSDPRKRSLDYEYAAVRGASEQGVSHWHIVVWVDGDVSREAFAPAIDAHIRNSEVADADTHDLADAVKVNTAPSSDLKPIGKLDADRGSVSQITRYVATQIPHVSSVGELSDAESLQGAIEWAAPSRGFRTSSGISVSKEDGHTCRQPKKETPTSETDTATFEETDTTTSTPTATPPTVAEAGTADTTSRRLTPSLRGGRHRFRDADRDEGPPFAQGTYHFS